MLTPSYTRCASKVNNNLSLADGTPVTAPATLDNIATTLRTDLPRALLPPLDLDRSRLGGLTILVGWELRNGARFRLIFGNISGRLFGKEGMALLRLSRYTVLLTTS